MTKLMPNPDHTREPYSQENRLFFSKWDIQQKNILGCGHEEIPEM